MIWCRPHNCNTNRHMITRMYFASMDGIYFKYKNITYRVYYSFKEIFRPIIVKLHLHISDTISSVVSQKGETTKSFIYIQRLFLKIILRALSWHVRVCFAIVEERTIVFRLLGYPSLWKRHAMSLTKVFKITPLRKVILDNKQCTVIRDALSQSDDT